MSYRKNDELVNNNGIRLAIDRYLFESSDPFALQLDGQWGTGKTYFIQHTIYNDIKPHNGIPVYVSLNGVHSYEELRNKVGYAFLYSRLGNPRKKNKLKILSMNLFYFLGNSQDSLKNLLSGKIPIPKDFSSKLDITNVINKFADYFSSKKIILIFDDLERACFSNVQILMGELLDIMNKFQCKVIIISNEDTPKLQSDYFQNIKEKIISKTILFGYDSKGTAKDILNNKIVNDNILGKSWILKSSDNLLKCLKNINLRTVLSIVYDYNVLAHDVINTTYSDRLKRQGLKTGFLSLFTLTDAIKRNKDTSQLKEIYNKDCLNLFMTLNLIKKTEDNKKIDYKSDADCYLLTTFLNKSDYTFKKNILYNEEIYNLICSESFNVKYYLKMINNIFRLDKNPLYQKLYDDHELMSDKELVRNEKKFRKSLNLNNISLDYLFDVYSLITRLKNENLLLIDFHLSSIERSINFRIANISPNELRKSTFLVNFVFPRIENFKNSKFKENLNNMLDCKRKNIPRARDEQALDYLSKGNLSLLNNINLFNHNSIFYLIMSVHRFNDKIRSSPKFIISLRSYLYIHIIHIGNSYDTHYIELDYIDSFQKFIKNLIKSCNGRVLQHDFRSLLKSVRESKRVLLNQKSHKN